MHGQIQEARKNLAQSGLVDDFKEAYLKAINDAKPILYNNGLWRNVLNILCYTLKTLFNGELPFSYYTQHKWGLFSAPKNSAEKIDTLHTNLEVLLKT